MVKECCKSPFMLVGFIKKKKYEVFICPVCGAVYFPKTFPMEKIPWAGRYMEKKGINIYDFNQVRAYWLLGDEPVIYYDKTGTELQELDKILGVRNEETIS